MIKICAIATAFLVFFFSQSMNILHDLIRYSKSRFCQGNLIGCHDYSIFISFEIRNEQLTKNRITI